MDNKNQKYFSKSSRDDESINVFLSPRGMMKLKQKILTSNINIRETTTPTHTHIHTHTHTHTYYI